MVYTKVSRGFKASEALLGIETDAMPCVVAVARGDSRFKASEALLGIETGA